MAHRVAHRGQPDDDTDLGSFPAGGRQRCVGQGQLGQVREGVRAQLWGGAVVAGRAQRLPGCLQGGDQRGALDGAEQASRATIPS